MLVLGFEGDLGDMKIEPEVSTHDVPKDILLINSLAAELWNRVFEHGYPSVVVGFFLRDGIALLRGPLAQFRPLSLSKSFTVEFLVAGVDKRRKRPAGGVVRQNAAALRGRIQPGLL